MILFELEKVPQKYPQQFHHFSGVGDDFSYEKKLHQAKIYIGMFTTSILTCMKKANTCKNISPTCKYLSFIFKLPQMLSPNVLASSVKQHDYNNLTFEVHANKGFKKCTQK